MTELIKDQLVKALKEMDFNKVYTFKVLEVDCNPDFDSESICKWKIHIIPDHGYLPHIDHIVDTARKIDRTFLITLMQDEKSYLSIL